MKKLLILLVVSVSFLSACNNNGEITTTEETNALPKVVTSIDLKDSKITMDNVDDYLFRDDVQYVDLRNFDDKFNSGYISGFEIIPFFQFLEGNMVTRSTESGKAWDASEATVNDDFAFENYFDKDKAIFLMCASGTRAGYLKAILDDKGYTTYNVGGFNNYDGDNKVLGDGEFTLVKPFPEAVTSIDVKDSAITIDNIDQYLFRSDVQYVDLRNFDDKFNSGYIRGFEMIPFFQFLEGEMVTRSTENGKVWDPSEGTVNDNFAFENYFDKDKAIFLMCASGTRAGYVKAILDAEGYITYNIGGFNNYDGNNKTLGDGEYSLPTS
ncbi:rhodanese-like domain-containing protein [Haloplasma contractile]|uniref:Rhodanese domain protein n=1 Tax=Haloplasma contractile SSD-17B TaxID=1033810 RepID=U2FPS9_9MOLU|nr:rhodanese-like domain-containing protein [Haloplasma contractile]ERJ13044.1 Rhodanese domain protein [Haloplasma contractile SSD-17B]